MFTGMIEAAVPLLAVEAGTAPGGRRLRLAAPSREFELALGESLAVNGCCLSLAQRTPSGELVFELSSETLARTRFGRLRPGARLNLERALRLADRLGGHLVSGHVDAIARVHAFEDSGDGGRRLQVELPEGLERYLVDKGSVALDGVSLTVVRPQGSRFGVALIPLTLAHTSLGELEPGDELHVEVDMLAKFVERLLQARGS